ncbi:hypothetical protein [Caldisericum sp.]|uniref:hypothetical protein n=1 Tax=Caldisericum sp. TaxID=2499687 RepID=UPI003D0CDAD7
MTKEKEDQLQVVNDFIEELSRRLLLLTTLFSNCVFALKDKEISTSKTCLEQMLYEYYLLEKLLINFYDLLDETTINFQLQ